MIADVSRHNLRQQQKDALNFYRDKLGFKLHTDAMVGEDFRWLTITPDQPDFEIVLMEPKPEC